MPCPGRRGPSDEFEFSESPDLSYKDVRDHVLTVVSGEVTSAKRLNQPSNIRWEIKISPDSDSDVAITLPATTDCSTDGAVCMGDDRKMSTALFVTIPGPVQNTPATGAPTISGIARVGDTLAVDTSGITDADGLSHVSYSYQWIRKDGTDEADISGATRSTYTLVDTDQGKTIKSRVSFTDDADNYETLTSVATTEVAAQPNRPSTGAPTIARSARVGDTLIANTSGIADVDGLTNVSYSYQWIRKDGTDESDISGATGNTFTLMDADKGKTIKVRVSFTDDNDNEESLTSAPTNTVVGPALTARAENVPGTHQGEGSFSFELQFSEEFELSYKTLRDQAFTVTGGTVKAARRLNKPSNTRWEIVIEPDSAGDVTVVLPIPEDCDDGGAICTEDGRKLSNRLEFTVSGPNA